MLDQGIARWPTNNILSDENIVIYKLLKNFYFNLNSVTQKKFGFKTKQVRARGRDGSRFNRIENVITGETIDSVDPRLYDFSELVPFKYADL